MRILGIDPGSRFTGFGIIDVQGDNATLVRHGVIRTGKGEFTERLGVIFAELRDTDRGASRRPRSPWKPYSSATMPRRP